MSYLLVSFWYDNLINNKSALKALNFNKIGDIAYLLGICLCYYYFKSFDLITMSAYVNLALHYKVSCFGI
jgi:NADH-quinone oxidoreductase subunit L